MAGENDYIFGIRAVIEAIRSGRHLDRLLLKHGLQGSLYHELMNEVKNNNIPYQIVPQERIDLVTRKNHQGVLAWLSLIEYQTVTNILPGIYEKGEDPLIIILDRISDVRNFGAIIRTAECLGAHAALISEKGSARITADSVKTSAGALHTFPVCREKSILKSVMYLKDSGLRIFAATEKNGSDLTQSDLTGPSALVFGSEERGISRELLELSDLQLKIPMEGKIGSLNVSVAAGIFMYEIKRQRKK
jgi:23S rRNA (guanosine2251-2'-O)-methyltransferase